MAVSFMEKERFIFLVQHKTSLTAEETVELMKLSRSYPYAQVIHNLVARGMQDLGQSEKEARLQLAAVYANDRQVLKELLGAPREPREEPPVATTTDITSATTVADVAPEPVPEPVEEVPAVPATEVDIEQLRHDLLDDLKRMLSLKSNFERSVEDFEKSRSGKGASTTGKKKTKEEPEEVPTDALIEEIKSTKKKVRSGNPKQKEQTEIIDQFIKAQPSIPKPKPVSVDKTEDLSDTGETYNENVVSETLVEILIRQGKREKAQEVLRKLIWKFPQKKAYFAAQIESLKK